jgi:ubiquinone/menaquinone biosynthesis C-methylase UbiE
MRGMNKLDNPTPYMFTYSSQEYERLRLQAAAWEQATTEFLDRVGVVPGMRCCDLGCGIGDVLPLLAVRVGQSGEVVGVDKDPQALKWAFSRIASLGLSNVELIQAEVNKPPFRPGQFDLTYCRALLMHTPDPVATVKQMTALSRPGGIVAAQEFDNGTIDHYPEFEAFRKFKETFLAVFSASGAEARMGRRLYRVFCEAGLAADVTGWIRVRRSNDPAYLNPVYSLISLRQKIIDLGLLKEVELNAIIEELRAAQKDSRNSFVSPLVIGAWARVPCNQC